MFRWITPGERALLVAIAIGLTSCGWGALAYLIVGHYLAWVAYGCIFGGAVAYMAIRSSELTAWAMLEYQQAEQEYNRFKLLEDTQPVTLYQSTTTALVGRIQVDQRRYIRDRLQAGIRLSARNYPRVDKATWDELHRMGLIQYVNGKPNAGVELTPAGYQWARIPRPTA